MQIRSLEAANSSAIAGLQKSHRTVDAEWAETIEMTLGTESGSSQCRGCEAFRAFGCAPPQGDDAG